MLAKFGLLLLVLLFGATLFVAGTLAPEPVAGPVRAGGLKVLAWFAEEGSQAETTSGSAAPSDRDPIPYSSLIPPAGAAEKQPYGLQVGLYGSLAEADQQALKLTANNIDFTLVPVRDSQGVERQLVVAGPYETRGQARVKSGQLPRILDADSPPELLLFPPQPQ